MKLYVLLGKLGDIVSFLPVLHAESKSGKPASLMVAKEYAPVLEGCSYVKAIPFDGAMHELDRAMEKAHQISTDVVCVQVAGPPDMVKRHTYEPHNRVGSVTDSFVRESWKLADKLGLWKEQPPVVFDQRNIEREQELVKSVRKWRNSPILVATGGNTSPFPFSEPLIDLVRWRNRSKHEVIDVSAIKAERFYDLCGLYKGAECLIASDSAPLHLAQAFPKLPVFALVKDEPTPWHGSPWRPNHIFHCRYKDWPKRWPEMRELLGTFEDKGQYFYPSKALIKIVHVWDDTDHAPNPHQASWDREYEKDGWIKSPAQKGMFGRDSKGAPFIKDMLRCASYRCGDNDILCLTRSDIGVHCSLTELLREGHPCYAHRALDDNGLLTFHPAVDLFSFTKKFWNEHSKELPEFAMTRDPHWHRVMMEWLIIHGGKMIPFCTFRKPTSISAVNTNRYNEELATPWLAQRGITSTAAKVTSQRPGVQINRRGLAPGAYNGCLIQWNGRYLLSYRWHRDKTLSTALAIAELDGAFNVRSSKPIELAGKSLEDARMWVHGTDLMVSYVESNWPAEPALCITRYGKLIEGAKAWEVEGQWKPDYGKNAWNGLEKNWSPFHVNGHNFFIYSSSPKQAVLEMEGHEVRVLHTTDFPHWPYGTVKGGCIAGMHKGKLLRFFHSRLDNEPRPYGWRYYVGAALMEPEPPFQTVALSSEPILRGSELDDLQPIERNGVSHWKSKVVFPMGAVQTPSGIFELSCGINDSACAVVTIDPSRLNL